MASQMRSHPRRRPQKLTTSPLTPPASPTPASLQKSDTFTARSPSSDLYHPLENAPFVPKRSPTSLADLVLHGVDDGTLRQEKLAKFLGDIDDVVTGRSSPDVLGEEEQVWATIVDDQVPLLEPMLIDEKKDDDSHNHHYSDSGLGSSVDSPIEPHSVISARSNAASTATTSFSAINQSHSFENAHRPRGRRLSKTAFQHIDQHFLQPILKDTSLKEFHPLIEAIPRQVGDNFISNLRDLEKTLLYQAPVSLSTYLSACAVAYYHRRDVKKFCLSSKAFRDFWTFSISCLHTTVQYLNDRDQRRPSDRPYTSTYFVDLVEQIRRYADLMARTRSKEANGEDLDEMDYSADETVTLEGTPAGLVRTKKSGKSFPVAPENSHFETMSSKRPLSDDEYDSEDDDVLRSMARRRKSDKAADVVHTCRSCSKEFKRPCDLTKHEKTHSRPFKCSDPSCRYHELGWPTEKERDRHENDKHSSNPTLYKCEFQPCSYSSKRESNCKQHMEKAHGWTYVRSKSNGKKRATNGASPSSYASVANTPGSSHQTFGSPESSLTTPSPLLGNSLSPPDLFNSMHNVSRRDSATTDGTVFSANASPYNGFAPMEPMIPTKGFAAASPFVADIDLGFAPTFYQQPTPAQSAFDLDFDNTEAYIPTTTFPDPMSTLHTNGMDLLNFDETFGNGHGLADLQTDFQLFEDSPTSAGADLDNTNWFPDLNGNVDHFGELDFDSTSGFYQQ